MVNLPFISLLETGFHSVMISLNISLSFELSIGQLPSRAELVLNAIFSCSNLEGMGNEESSSSFAFL